MDKMTSTVQKALRAVLYEVTVNPKPGLVDPVSQGAHKDMDVFTFIDSAVSLQPYFEQAYQIGLKADTDDLVSIFQTLRVAGKTAEETMFQATTGVNTHKGAIFSLGILLAATGYAHRYNRQSTVEILTTVKGMLINLTQADFAKLSAKQVGQQTAGERQFLQFGKTGIRGEAEAGFPTVAELGLPFLRKATGTRNQQLLDTLLFIASGTEDSNLIKRAGTPTVIDWLKPQIDQYFKLGGSKTKAGMQFLEKLDQVFIERNLSLGGSADLLILTTYLALLEEVI